jgi:hypothetical protein
LFQDRAVPLFYFDISDGTGRGEDYDGTDLRDLDAAKLQAAVWVTELMRERLSQSPSEREVSVTVLDYDRAPLARVALALTIEDLKS